MRDVKVDNQLYTDLLNSYQQLRLVKEGKVGNVRIVDSAISSENKIKPKSSIILGISACWV
jgi:tyrosine-protein kinase Etk/Wzc